MTPQEEFREQGRQLNELKYKLTSSRERSNYKSRDIYKDRGMAMHIATAEAAWITLDETASS